MIASIVLPALFAGSGAFAFAALVLAWNTYGGELKAIRRQMAALEDQRVFTVQLALTETREFIAPTRRATVRQAALRRPRPRTALRAAA